MAAVTSEKFFYDIGSRYDAIVIGEKHFAQGNEKFYNDPGFYKGLSRAGYGALAVELPVELQPMIDAYYKGNKEYFGLADDQPLTPEAMYKDLRGFSYENRSYTHVELAAQLAKQIDFSRANNMKVIAMDVKAYEDRREPRVPSDEYRFVKEILDKKGVTPDQLRKEIGIEDRPNLDPYFWVVTNEDMRNKYLSAQEQENLKSLIDNEGTAERMRMDAGWFGHLKESLPAGTKILAIVGTDHPANIIPLEGIDEFLGGDDKVATIYLQRSAASYDSDKERMAKYTDGGTQPPTDEPHAVIYTDSMTMKIGDKMDVEGYEAGEEVQMQSAASPPPAPVAKPAAAAKP